MIDIKRNMTNTVFISFLILSLRNPACICARVNVPATSHGLGSYQWPVAPALGRTGLWDDSE